jgi:hypothetical protein
VVEHTRGDIIQFLNKVRYNRGTTNQCGVVIKQILTPGHLVRWRIDSNMITYICDIWTDSDTTYHILKLNDDEFIVFSDHTRSFYEAYYNDIAAVGKEFLMKHLDKRC